MLTTRIKYLVILTVKLATDSHQQFKEITTTAIFLPTAKQGIELQLPSSLSMCSSVELLQLEATLLCLVILCCCLPMFFCN